MISYLIVGLGGGLGAITRVALMHLFPSILASTQLPVKILAINIIGCLAIGFIAQWLDLFEQPAQSHLQNFLVAGFLGGFTTFSAFSLEFWLLIDKQALGTAVFYLIISFTSTLIAFFIGYNVRL